MQNYNENGVVIVQPKNNNNLLLIIVGLLLIIGVGVGCYFLGKSTSDDNTTKEDKKEEGRTNNTTSNDIIDTMSKVGYTFELNKCLNCSNISSDITIKTIADNGLQFVKVNVGDDDKTVEIKLLSEIINGYGANIKDRTIVKQLNNEIKQVLVTSYGGDTGLATILYLMKDGTIKYTKIWDEVLKADFDNLSDDNLFNTKDFNDIKNIVKIVPVMYGGDLPSYGIIAIQDNGSFYNLNVE